MKVALKQAQDFYSKNLSLKSYIYIFNYETFEEMEGVVIEATLTLPMLKGTPVHLVLSSHRLVQICTQ